MSAAARPERWNAPHPDYATSSVCVPTNSASNSGAPSSSNMSTTSRRFALSSSKVWFGTHISAGRRKHLHFVLEAASQSIPFYFKIIMRLQVEPELCGRSKKSCEPKRRVGGDGPGAVHNFIDSPGRHADAVRQPILREP